MELLVLGCDGTYPGANGATSGYLLDGGEEGRVLMDCGSGVLARLMARMDPADLKAVALTHWHHDHVADLPVLRYYLMTRGKRLPLYAPSEGGAAAQMISGPEFEVRDIRDGFQAGDLRMTVVPVHHPVPTFALRWQQEGKSLVYTGDSGPCEELAAFSKGADLLICDASCLQRDWHQGFPHMSARQAGALAGDAGAGLLLLTHCPPHVDGQGLLQEAREVFRQSENIKALKRYRP